jgi:Zn-dependent protease with chaperone function
VAGYATIRQLLVSSHKGCVTIATNASPRSEYKPHFTIRFSMTEEKFAALVEKLEPLVRAHPDRYRRRVILLAAFGNLYLLAVVALLLAMFGASLISIGWLKFVGVKLAIVTGVLLSVVIRALFVTVDLPRGIEIDAIRAPALFNMIHELRRATRTPRFHHVLMTDDFNAGVTQRSRLGMLGWPRNYLQIGLPLMKALSVDQFKAVLAHEFGHLGKGHGKTANWVYRQRIRWTQLMKVLDSKRSRANFLFKPVLDRYAPYLNAYSFPLARANEFEADATSVRLTSSKTAAEALTAVHVIGSYLSEKFWPQIHQTADDEPTPSVMPYAALSEQLATRIDPAESRLWMDKAMNSSSSLSDTHPALKDRLDAIGEKPQVALPLAAETADRLLGDARSSLTEQFDRRWRDRILPSWKEHYLKVFGDRRTLAAFNDRLANGEQLTLDDAVARAALTRTVGKDPLDALSQLKTLHQNQPDNAKVCFNLGVSLMHQADDDGLALVEESTRLDPNMTASACAEMRNYHWSRGRKEEANRCHKRFAERMQLQQSASYERQNVFLIDQFRKPDFGKERLEALREQLQKIRFLRRVYFLEKVMRFFPEHKCYVLAFKSTGPFQRHDARRAIEVAKRIREDAQLPEGTTVINVDGKTYKFARKFRRLRWSQLI